MLLAIHIICFYWKFVYTISAKYLTISALRKIWVNNIIQLPYREKCILLKCLKMNMFFDGKQKIKRTYWAINDLQFQRENVSTYGLLNVGKHTLPTYAVHKKKNFKKNVNKQKLLIELRYHNLLSNILWKSLPLNSPWDEVTLSKNISVWSEF